MLSWIPACAAMTRAIACGCLCSVALLSGCVSTRPVGEQAGWPLLAPVSLGESRQATQTLHGDYDGSSFSLRSVVSVDTQQLVVIGVTSMGMRAFTVKYDGHDLHEERAPQVPAAVQAHQLLNDLQLAFWPLSVLQQAWRSAGGEVSEPYAGTRRLQRKGKLLAEVHYAADPWQGRVWLRHFDHPYSLFIESTAMDKVN